MNHWEMYLSHDTADVINPSVLLRSLYEAQNPTLVPHYYAAKIEERYQLAVLNQLQYLFKMLFIHHMTVMLCLTV